ncbi:hypothetical protein Ddye_030838 [Dipteronia dyeriana]|uniref:Uncharacterized protein n=1 Tax=Dipteronia dyeriana TaxID=168575 RepID=A0AAD9WLY4_9ROSI|nr:hypothetical protein Ddye_030838 [Dipteronia dyeriana]
MAIPTANSLVGVRIGTCMAGIRFGRNNSLSSVVVKIEEQRDWEKVDTCLPGSESESSAVVVTGAGSCWSDLEIL